MKTDVLLRAQDLRAQRTPFVLATVVRVQRPTSAKPGDSALVLADGTVDGFVGGACAASTVRLQSLRLLETGESTLLRITPGGAGTEPEQALAPVDGLVTVTNHCLSGGTLEIFLEAMIPPTLVHVFGDAPVARALVRVGQAIGYDVVGTADPEQPIAADTAAVVVASHGRDEEPVLRAAVRAGVPYVALIASRRRGNAVLAGLDLGDDQRARVRTPAGLDIGARTAAEVALSILAEIIAARPRGRVVDPHADPAPTDRASPATPDTPAMRAPLATAIDPVCAMTVAVTPGALAFEYAGSTWYFCGPGCRTAFADDPGRYGA